MFGEGVVNDAVSILIYQAMEKIIEENRESGEEFSIGARDIGVAFGNFLYLSVVSIIIGVAFGLFSAFVLKNVKTMKEHPVMEIFFLLLASYLCYVIAEMSAFSGIMTIFCCGFTMSHYAYYNISEESKNGSVLTVSTLGYAAEAFLFTYLGLGIFGIN